MCSGAIHARPRLHAAPKRIADPAAPAPWTLIATAAPVSPTKRTPQHARRTPQHARRNKKTMTRTNNSDPPQDFSVGLVLGRADAARDQYLARHFGHTHNLSVQTWPDDEAVVSVAREARDGRRQGARRQGRGSIRRVRAVVGAVVAPAAQGPQ